MRILFLSTRKTKPSFRFRVEQFLPRLEQAGFSCDVQFLDSRFWKRIWDYRRIAKYNIVVVQKKLFGSLELQQLRRHAEKLVYDLDDAIMLDSTGQKDNRRERRFRNMMRSADLVICGNLYLQDRAAQFAENTVHLPTGIDTDTFSPEFHNPTLPFFKGEGRGEGVEFEETQPVTLGWTGSSSTNRYLNELFPVFLKFGNRIQLKILSDSENDFDYDKLGEVPYRFVCWKSEIEVDEARTFDIGLMPLPENDWTKGKCGFKAIQYLSLGIPAIVSPVGVNCEIVRRGVHGFHAKTNAEWAKSLEMLIVDEALRDRMGTAGREHVKRNYSVKILSVKMIEVLKKLHSTRKRCAA